VSYFFCEEIFNFTGIQNTYEFFHWTRLNGKLAETHQHRLWTLLNAYSKRIDKNAMLYILYMLVFVLLVNVQGPQLGHHRLNGKITGRKDSVICGIALLYWQTFGGQEIMPTNSQMPHIWATGKDVGQQVVAHRVNSVHVPGRQTPVDGQQVHKFQLSNLIAKAGEQGAKLQSVWTWSMDIAEKRQLREYRRIR